MGICEKLNIENVLFITKKKAISSIKDDYHTYGPGFYLEVINYESIHKISDKSWDVIICDEAHSMGAFPKPSKRAKTVKELIQDHQPYVILMSGTPTPESFSQMYHQVYGVPGNPFSKHRSFYKFASEYVKIVQKKINGYNINDYSKGLPRILDEMNPYTISYSQKEAGFKSVINEKVLLVPISEKVSDMIKVLKKDLVYEIDGEYILGDTAVKFND